MITAFTGFLILQAGIVIGFVAHRFLDHPPQKKVPHEVLPDSEIVFDYGGASRRHERPQLLN